MPVYGLCLLMILCRREGLPQEGSTPDSARERLKLQLTVALAERIGFPVLTRLKDAGARYQFATGADRDSSKPMAKDFRRSPGSNVAISNDREQILSNGQRLARGLAAGPVEPDNYLIAGLYEESAQRAVLPALQSQLSAAASTDGSGGWQLIITPNGWIPMMDGEVTIGPITETIDLSLDDLVDTAKYLDWGGMGYVELRRRKWGVFTEFLFMKLSADASADVELLGLRQGRFAALLRERGLAVDLKVDAKFDFIQALFELGFAYRLLERPMGSIENGSSIAVDLLAGGRYWYLEAKLDAEVDVTASVPGPLGPTTITRSRSLSADGHVDWIDPFIGARTFVRLTDKLDLILRGDIGGFGIGSDFTWKVSGLVNYNLSPRTSLYAGYQALGVDYSEGSGSDKFELDLVMHGPVIGFAKKFGGPRGERIDEARLSDLR